MNDPRNPSADAEFPDRENILAKVAGGRLLVLGTVHLSPDFETVVDSIVREEHPDLVLVELDPQRLAILEALDRGDIEISQVSGPDEEVPSLLQKVQTYFANQVGVMPGAEMLRAVRTARELGIPYDFMDLPIEETISNLNNVTETEQAAIISELKQLLSGENLAEVEAAIEDYANLPDLLPAFNREFPELSQVVLATREDHMVRVIRQWLRGSDHQKILVVCGLGHKDTLLAALGKD